MSKYPPETCLAQEQRQPEHPPASPPDRCKYPPPIEYTPYFPPRILGYITYQDDLEPI